MKLKKIVLMLVLILFPFGVSADSLECPKVALLSQEISCRLKIDNIVGVKANYSFGNSFTYLDVVPSDNFKTYYKDKKGFAAGNIIDDMTMDAVIKIKVADNLELNKSYSLKVTNIEGTDRDGKIVTIGDIKTSVKIVSDNAYLEKLSLSNIKFTESFRKDKYVYYAETLEGSTVISAMAEDKSAIVGGDIGNKVLNYGINLFVVKVTSVYGYTREYKIYITREYDKSLSDATLKSIILSDGKIDFKKDKFLYEVSVENEVETIDVEAVATNSKAIVDIDKPDKLEVGDNQIIITVTVSDGTQCKYIVKVTRKEKVVIEDYNDAESDKTTIEVKDEDDGSKNKRKFSIIVGLLVLGLLIILIFVIKSMIKFIKKNSNE